jgi:hypothetical protein
MLMYAVISGDRKMIKKEAEKILKHKDLTIEIQRVWNVKNESYIVNNVGNWNQMKIIHKNNSPTNRESTK